MLDRGSFVGFCGPLVNIWFDHCWIILDSWVISSLRFQMELFVSLPCSEGLEWVVSLEISVLLVGNFGGWRSGKMEDSLGSSHLEGELFVAEGPHPCGFCINSKRFYLWSCGCLVLASFVFACLARSAFLRSSLCLSRCWFHGTLASCLSGRGHLLAATYLAASEHTFVFFVDVLRVHAPSS